LRSCDDRSRSVSLQFGAVSCQVGGCRPRTHATDSRLRGTAAVRPQSAQMPAYRIR
jgi:hypothetical protein